jgi:nickel-dependent lactate racemase
MERKYMTMALKTYTFKYGKGTQSVSLPEEHIRHIIEPRLIPAVPVKEAVQECMRHPIGSAPLSEKVHPGDHVCIVAADITRAWNRTSEFMVHIVNELNAAGIPDQDISIVFAQGTHRAHTAEEDRTVVGEEVTRRISLYQHDCHNQDELVRVGTTSFGTPVDLNKHVVEADVVIVVNGILPHLFAGFGGGRKMILPGVAGWETIQKNHAHALSPVIGEGINPATANRALSHNPVNLDMLEGMEMCRPDFLVHSLINSEGQICGFVGGDPYEAWLEGTRRVMANSAAVIDSKADVTIACAGGYPKDLSLYQGCKCYEPAEAVTKKGGIIIAIIESPDIREPKIFWDSFRYETRKDMEQALRECFTIPFFIAFYLFTLTHQYTMYLVTRKENFEAVRKTHQIPCASLEEAWSLAKAQLEREGKTDYTINMIPHCGSVIPTVK